MLDERLTPPADMKWAMRHFKDGKLLKLVPKA